MKSAFLAKRIDCDYETFSVHGFRLGIIPESPPKIYVAALQQKMLKMAAAEADGAIINWLSADDVSIVAPIVHAEGNEKEVITRILVAPTEDASVARAVGRRLVSTYLTCQWPISSTRWWPGKVPTLHVFVTSFLARTDLLWLGPLSS
ncbi:MAG: LLM class flavin-dependent oxidoreductase, partial [Acidimicrobiales bacterium]